jgi:undecaprenyl diphosphate synthase
MDQSTLWEQPSIHVAIIMDGNGRWATSRSQSRSKGHQAGARALREIVEAAPEQGINTLTLFAFSSDNWERPKREVAALMHLFRFYLRSEVATCVERGARVNIVGRRDRLPRSLRAAIEAVEKATVGGDKLHIRIALDYSARDAIVRAAHNLPPGIEVSRETFARLLGEGDLDGPPVPDVDLLIRTGGEQRLSDFLLWECAYAELHFTKRMWPDFTAADLESAVHDFNARQRRFGRLPTNDQRPTTNDQRLMTGA